MVEEILEGSGEAFAAIDERGRAVAWNERARELFGVSSDEARGRDLFELTLVPQARPAVYEALNRYLATHRSEELPRRAPCRLLSAEGEALAAELTIVALSEPNGARFHVFFHEHTLAERAERRLEAIIEASGEAIITTDAEGRIETWNQAASRLYGYTPEEIIGQPLAKLIPDRDEQEQDELFEAALGGVLVEDAPTERLTRSGEVRSVEVTMAPIYEADADRPSGVSLVEHDVSAHRDYEERLSYLTTHDVLTGLHNREAFHGELSRRLERGERGSVLIVDLDAFHSVNDLHGHEGGDEVLRALARLLAEQLAEGDELAHLQSDEFAMLISDTGDRALERAAQVMADVERKLAAQLSFEPDHRLACSIGISEFGSEEIADADEYLLRAELALQGAKERGGGRSVVYEVGWVSGARQAQRLRRALREQRLVLYAQPILDIASGQVRQHELLLRVRDENGVISAASFLAAAERLGVIGEIDRWVVERGIELAARGLRVEINLSARSMTDQSILRLIRDRIAASGADPADVIFEITETAAIASLEEAREFARELEAIGCKFALDDFGTGFGSFTYLKHLPVAVLKIDGEFIRNLGDPEAEIDRHIVRAIVLVAEALGHETVAEWVGDEESLEALRELGVSHAQGYLIGEPVPAEEVLAGRA